MKDQTGRTRSKRQEVKKGGTRQEGQDKGDKTRGTIQEGRYRKPKKESIRKKGQDI